MFERLAEEVPETGWLALLFGFAGDGRVAVDDVEAGVKIGGEEEGGSVIVGRVGIVDTTLLWG